MSDLAEVHHQALEATRRLVAGVTGGQWSLPTPCEDWNVRYLVNHMVTGNWWAAELGAGRTIEDVGDRLDGDILGDDPLEAYDRSATAAQAAFDAPGAMDAPCAVSYGPVPGSVFAGHRFVDVLIHGWDLAVATGQSTELDPELVDACWVVLKPQLERLQGGGSFGRQIDVSDDADPQIRLLAALGRRAAHEDGAVAG